MPKQFVPALTPRGGIKGWRVYVGWSKGGYVQIGSSPPTAIGPILAGLDRNGVNQLILVLRGARDQAFGRDQ